MKKILFILCLVMITNSAFADSSCEGGETFEGNNGHIYCIGKPVLNWWAAFSWCQTQGRHLASLQEACDNWTGTDKSTQCANLIKDGISEIKCWAANPYGSDNAYTLRIGTGTIHTTNIGRANGQYQAFCY